MADPEWPTGRYKLLQTAEVPRSPEGMRERLLEGEEIVYQGKPGPHMEPLDDAAKEAVAIVEAEGGFGTLDPVSRLDLSMMPTTTNEIMSEKLQDMAAENKALKERIAVLEARSAAPVRAAPPPPPAPPMRSAPPPPPPPRVSA